MMVLNKETPPGPDTPNHSNKSFPVMLIINKYTTVSYQFSYLCVTHDEVQAIIPNKSSEHLREGFHFTYQECNRLT